MAAVGRAATPVAIGGSCGAVSVRAAIEQFAEVRRTNRHMSSSTVLTMLLVAAGSGAFALTAVRALSLVFPRARS